MEADAKGESRLGTRVFLVAAALAVLPIAVATVRAIDNDWLPLGDNALVEIRSRDVATDHHPLVGTASSASLTAGIKLNHPGPLYFDAVALPVRVFGGERGTAIGVAFVNTMAAFGVAVFARRRGGAVLGVAAAATVAVLCWSVGSEVLFEPWNPHAMLLPFLLFLVLVWSCAAGDLVALPWAAGVGSLVLQTHLSYSLLVPGLSLFAIGALGVALRRERTRASETWHDRRRRAQRIGILTAGVVLACWIQPIIEQFTSEGQGNLARLVQSTHSSDAHRAGLGFGTQLFSDVVSLPPFWLRPSFGEAFFRIEGWTAPSLTVAIISLVALVAVLVGCALLARRSHDGVAGAALATAVTALAIGFVTTVMLPVDNFDISTHALRWMWPLSAFLTLAIGTTLLRGFLPPTRAKTGIWVLGGLTLLFAALAIPTLNYGNGPNGQDASLRGAHELNEQLGQLDDEGPLLIDDLFKVRFNDPYGPAVLAEIQRREIPFVVHDEVLVRQFGSNRRFDGDNARNVLLIREGDDARETPSGSRRVAFSEGLPAPERREFTRLRRQIADYVRDGRLELNDAGQQALVAGALPDLARELPGPVDPQSLFRTREISVIGASHWLDGDEVWQRRFERFAELQGRADARTVALFVQPVRKRT